MPKRKATSQISGLLGSDDEDLMQLNKEDPQAEPPAKKRRGRPRTSDESAPETKPVKSTRAKKQPAAVTELEAPAERKSTRRGRPKGSGRASQDAVQAAEEEAEDLEPANDTTQDQENEDPEDSKTTRKPARTTKAKAAPAAKRGRAPARAGAAKKLQVDDEFEYTPKTARQASVPEDNEEQPDPSPVPRAAAPGRRNTEVEETQQIAVEESVFPDPTRRSMSPHKHRSFRPSLLRNPQDSPNKRKSDLEQGGDPELRRRLGELTKKHDALDIKYRNLREIGILEANANMEKLRKQNEAITKASNELVASLRAELDAQRKLGTQSRGLTKQLKDRDAEITRLKTSADETHAQLASAQSETKALHTKLAAARNTAASLEGASKVPGSAIKGGPANRANAAANAEAAQAAQLAQLKEDLYSDLTGLIIRDVKDKDSDHVYDCIQTGINGTLHFHLAVPKASADFDNTEFQYLPLLDANRDRDLVNMLPDFLTVDITFKRGQAAKFYTRVIDALTKRRSLAA
ncbi:Monopolin complex subunit Csm1/Pcs1 [Penicillium brevicompactum]|uniref:Monopolin complex subunit Csm1/Pcs1 n=1 Tax=Penicillium brevicompactum TaxID=5074 RepID=A0A9W9QNV3_PENBR|nr:Monopolin complex subunit Csm1/Pcs1 [Penicillium brevicompactum]